MWQINDNWESKRLFGNNKIHKTKERDASIGELTGTEEALL
jgi:hypothetical protein